MKSEKIINFGELLSRAWKYVWKFKFLWLLGLLAGGSAGVSGNNLSYLFNSTPNSKTKDWQSIFSGHSMASSLPNSGKVLGVADMATPVFVMLLIFLLLLILVFLFVYLRINSKGAIICAVDRIDQDKKTSLAEAWSLGHKYFLRILGFSILYSLIIILPLLFLATPVIIMAVVRWYIPAIIVGIIFSLIYVVYAIYLALSVEYGERILVLKNKRSWESIKLGIDFFNKNWKNVLLTYLILIAVMLAAGTVLALGIILVCVILGALIYGVYLLNSIAAVIVGVPIALAFIIVMFVACGFIASFRSTILTLAYKEIVKLN